MTKEAQEFIDRSIASAADLALLFAGAPDDVMMLSLDQVRENLAVKLAETLGADAAARFAEAFVAAVVGHRREIEEAASAQRGRGVH